ncbi:MAG: protein kinase [Polyangiaceae bacterium]|nr:protein kinase [Polyangiaceae bacterium]
MRDSDGDDERSTLPQRRVDSGARGTLKLAPKAPAAESSSPRRTVSEALDRPLAMTDKPSDRYHVIEQLGRGGMGEVSRTFDAKIGREIALKTMLPQDPDSAPVAEARFLREARVQALLEHPAIVPVYDIGVGPDGLAFFTMKRVRGQTLYSVVEELRTGKITVRTRDLGLRRRLVAFVTVCLAMHYAHERGVIHRDLKPENVMLGAHGEVYVLDWGVAKIIEGASPSSFERPFGSEPTKPGEMFGTPGFMPPEQVLGQHEEVDAQSDVYALGSILYEIVTLRPLFDHPKVASVLEATLSSTREPPEVPAHAPPELIALALRCTKFSKSDRPTTARDIADEIERFLDGDRDEGMRKRLADQRASLAREHRQAALTGPVEGRAAARAAAMHEAGRALALVPEHTAAAETVIELIGTPPEAAPEETVVEMEALERGHLRGAVRDNAFRIATWLLVAPLGLAMGLRLPLIAAAIMGLIGLAVTGAVVLWRTGNSSIWARLGLCALTGVIAALVSSVFGPLVLVPGFAAMNTVVFGVQSRPRERPIVVLMGAASIVVPLLLEVAGVIPPSMRFENDTIVLLPRVANFPPELSLLFLTAVALFGVITPTFITGRVRDALQRVERDLVLQKWQLAQLSPRRR